MYDVKPDVKELLETIDGVTCSDTFPASPGDTPHITFTESVNRNYHAMKKERQTEIIITIDVWHTRSTGAISLQVDEKLAEIGFLREFAADLNDPSGMKRKNMRFRGVVDKVTGLVHQ